MFGLGVNRLGATNQKPFSPASLFNNGEAGVWYDPSAASGSLDWRKNLLEYTESFDNSYWAKTNTTITANATEAPDGTQTADKLVQNSSTGFHYINRAYAVSDYTLITNSIHAKAGGYNYLYIFGNNHTTGSSSGTVVNLTNGTIVTNGHDAVVESKGNGWYRVSTKHYKTSSLTLNTYVTQTSSPASEAGDGSSGIYIWGAQLEEASTASSYQPILSTFANAFKTAFPSHTLYQDYQGETPVTAVGEPVGLMLDKSEGLAQGPEQVTNGDFSNGLTGWSTANTNSTNTITVNNGAADIVGDGTVALNLNQTSVFTAGKVYRLTVDATVNAGNVGGIKVQYSGNDSSIGIITESGSYSFTFRPTSTTLEILRQFSGQATNVTIDNISVTEIQGSHATQPTSTKRPIYARHPEGGIRNLLNYTEQFDNWSISTATLTPNQIAAPDGTLTADKLTTLTTTLYRYASQAATLTQGNTYSVSCYVKNHSSVNSWLRVRGSISSGSVVINWSGASITSLTTNEPLVSSSFESVGNDWYRVTLTVNAAEVNSIIRIYPSDAGDSPSTGSIYIWGAQLEVATEASNYQKVVTDIDVTESGVGEVYYLKFDGVDDGMSINNLTSSSTPLTALFGYSATNADATRAKLLIDIQTGRTIFGASADSANHIGYFDGAWSQFSADSNAIKVLTYDLVENDAKIRVDGTQEYPDTTYDQRLISGDVSLFSRHSNDMSYAAGNMYQTILRAAESTDEEIAKAETYVANKTGLKAQVDGIATLDLNFGNNTYTAKNSNGGVI